MTTRTRTVAAALFRRATTTTTTTTTNFHHHHHHHHLTTTAARRQQQLQFLNSTGCCDLISFPQPRSALLLNNNNNNFKSFDHQIVRTYASTMNGGSSTGNNNNNSKNPVTPPPSSSSTTTTTANTTTEPYVSPFQDIFDTIQEGKTFLGTTEFHIPDHVKKVLKCGVPEHTLKFKTTTYGRLLEEPFVRPMEHRVTLQVPIKHIPLSDSQLLVLKEIVGTRYNPNTGILQLSSSQFGSRIENKRHVVSMLERTVESAKTLAERVEREVSAMKATE